MKKKHIWIIIVFVVILIVGFILYTGCPTEKQIDKEIINANYCSTKEDCIDLGPHCPFGCGILINKSEEVRIRSILDYFISTNKACKYSCSQIKGIVCLNNKCVVDVVN